jgi:hypothetical protein
MSNGDDENGDPEETAQDVEPADPTEFEQRLDDAAESVEAAETEADLDEIDETLDAIESDLDDAVFEPEIEDEAKADEDGDDDEKPNPRDDLEDRLSDLRDDVEAQRGPYLEEVTDEIESAEGTITTSEWTEEGEREAVEAVAAFFEAAGEVLDSTHSMDAETPAEAAQQLGESRETIGETELHPDTDADDINALLDATGDLTGGLDDAQVWTDLEVREQLRREGFYDVLEPENRKDFPPEWTAIKLYEKRGEIEPILSAMDKLDSDFMEANILDAIEHMAPEEAYEQVHGLAQRRNVQPVRILGRIGDERACDTLHDFLGGGDVKLETTSLRALGALGSEESTEPVAQRLAADNPGVRSAAARALGLIGDTRAIEPLMDVLDDDGSDEVRASAAWALNRIGTERALDALADYTDDRSYIVQVEAEKAAGV